MKIKDKDFIQYISVDEINEIIERLSSEINSQFAEKNPLFLVMMNGAFIFAADLLRKITIPCELDFVKYTSYSGMKSTGILTPVMPVSKNVTGRHVVVIEDMVDTGNTLYTFNKELKNLSPASITNVSMLLKPDAIQKPVQIDYVGKKIENRFVVGYGLDYDGSGRNLDSVYVLNE